MKETKTILPFEDHRQPSKGKESIVMVQIKKASEYDGAILEPVIVEHDEWHEGTEHDGDTNYISIVSYPETGKVICAVRSKSYTVVRDTYEDATGKYLPSYADVSFGFDGYLAYMNDVTIVDNMLIIRTYSFTNHKRNFGAGWYEVSRFIFKGNHVAYETREGFDANFNMQGYFHIVSKSVETKRKKADTIRDSKKRAKFVRFNTSKITCGLFDTVRKNFNELVFTVYPEFEKIVDSGKSYFNFFYMLNLWTTIHHGETVYKKVPERIREDLLKSRPTQRCYSRSGFYTRPTDEFFIYQENGLTCYYTERKHASSEEIITGERIYILENEMFYFRWNPILKKYTSSRFGKLCGQPFANKWGRDRYFKLPTEKNGTRTDRLIGIQADSQGKIGGINLLMALTSPIAEKILKGNLSIYLTEQGKSPIINGKFADIENRIYEYWNLSEETGTRSIADIFQTNKKGIAVLQHSSIRQTMHELLYRLNNELCNIKDPEIKMMTYVGLEYYRNSYRYQNYNIDADAATGYIERIARACRKNAGNNSRDMMNNFDGMIRLTADYFRLRSEFESIKPRLIEAGANAAEYEFPEFPKPAHLHHFHDAVSREVTRYKDLANAQKAAETSRKITEFSETEEYTKFLKTEDNENFTIVPATSGEDLVREGAFLHHCVGTYRERMARKESYIYFLRKVKDKTTPFYTMEVVKRNGRYMLNQCYTFHDKTEKSDDCKQFITDWANAHSISINCAV